MCILVRCILFYFFFSLLFSLCFKFAFFTCKYSIFLSFVLLLLILSFIFRLLKIHCTIALYRAHTHHTLFFFRFFIFIFCWLLYPFGLFFRFFPVSVFVHNSLITNKYLRFYALDISPIEYIGYLQHKPFILHKEMKKIQFLNVE